MNNRLYDTRRKERTAGQRAARERRNARIAAAQALFDGVVFAYRGQLDAWRKQEIEKLDRQITEALRAAYPDAAQALDEVVREASAECDAQCKVLDDALAAGLAELRAERERKRFAASARGRKAAAAQAEWEQHERRTWDDAVRSGWPSSEWARHIWQTQLPSDPIHPDQPHSPYRQWEAMRERWLAIHPEHRAMLESPDPDAWDAAEAARRGEAWTGSTRDDRHRWPA